MKNISSVFVAVDGEAKCGKTTVIEDIAAEAGYQELTFRKYSDPAGFKEWNFSEALASNVASGIAQLVESHAFENIITISAGNAFRAAALYQALLELNGDSKSEFQPIDTHELRNLLALDGIVDVLQNDSNIGRRVSTVARFTGVQALCGSLFADFALEAYQKDGGGNLVIADARDPIGHLMRNDRIGFGDNQIDPTTILPIYIDTPPDVAAERMNGDFKDNFATVVERRRLDATRDELPVVRPDGLIDNYDTWIKLLADAWSAEELAPVYRLENDRNVNLANIQYFSGNIAVLASDTAIVNYAKLSNLDQFLS